MTVLAVTVLTVLAVWAGVLALIFFVGLLWAMGGRG